MSKPPLIIFHGECFDGFTAAWVARKHFRGVGVEPEFFAAVYPPGGQDTKLPPDCHGRDIYMLDFCVGRGQLLELKGMARSLQVIDHHKTHEEACAGLDFCEFDMTRSGAGMTWDHFFGRRKEIPSGAWLVDYVEDRDLWKFELMASKTVNAFIMCQEMTWENWDAMTSLGIEEAEARGVGAEMYLERYVRDMKKLARRMKFPSVNADGAVARGDFHADIPVVNAPYLGTSELVGALAKDALFAVGWFQRADGLYQYSLRSRDSFDVGALAKRFGGGGHAQAAGFTAAERVV